MSDPYMPFTRESGLFVCVGNDGDELRLHQQGQLWHFHRWRTIPREWPETGERDCGPVAFGLTAAEIYDAAESLRRDADGKRPTSMVRR